MRKFRIRKDVNDYQVGNFIYHEEADRVKVSDVSGFCAHMVSKFIAKGRQLSLYLESARAGNEDAVKALELYAVSVFNLLCTVYDADLMMTVHQASVSCMERHKDIYGMKTAVTDESESEDLESVRECELLDRELRSVNGYSG